MRLVILMFFCMFLGTAHAAKPQDPVTPWAEAHASVITPGPTPEVYLTARGSFDPDGGTISYAWDFGDGNVGSGLDVVHTYGSEGFYVAVLTVTDSQGLFDVSSVELRLKDGDIDLNSAPLANAGPDQVVSVGSVAVLDGSNSVDPDGDILTYSWDFVSIPPTSTPQFNNSKVVAPSFEANVAGNYLIRLTVSDGSLTASAEVMVTTTP